MILNWPLDNIQLVPPIEPYPGVIYISQNFGHDGYFQQDTVINGKTYLKGTSMYSQFGLKGHDGMDFACATGTPVKAAHDGYVQFLKDSDGYGNNARLGFEADGLIWEVIYGHLQRYEGTDRNVKAGDIIAYSNNTGFSTGPHLHFGVRKYLNGQVLNYNNGFLGYVDPMEYLKGTTMILLKANNNPTVYVQSGDTLIGFDSMDSYNKFTAGHNPVIVTVDPAELAKFTIAPVVIKI